MENRVFISFKNTRDGELTPEYYMAKDLYEALAAKGIKAFWSGKTLIETGTDQYKEKIDRELDTCPILVVVGSSVDNIASRWVKYEWDGFASDILNGKNNRIFTYVDGVDPHELPRTLRAFQCFDRRQTPLETVVLCIKNALDDIDRDKALTDAIPTIDRDKALTDAVPTIDRDKVLTDAVPTIDGDKALTDAAPTIDGDKALTDAAPTKVEAKPAPAGKKLPILGIGLGAAALVIAVIVLAAGLHKKNSASDQPQAAAGGAAVEEASAESLAEEASAERSADGEAAGVSAAEGTTAEDAEAAENSSATIGDAAEVSGSAVAAPGDAAELSGGSAEAPGDAAAEEGTPASGGLDISNTATLELNGKRYQLVDSEGVTWKEADFWCRSNGGSLVMVKTEEDQKAIELLLQKGTATYYYLGAEDASYPENEFHWVDGTLVSDSYTNWGAGCPDNSQIENEYEDYLAIINVNGLYGQARFVWNDFRNDSGDKSRGFICEWEAD